MDAKTIKALIISPEISLKKTMEVMNVVASKVLFVVNKGERGQLIGSVSDGDIRRAILNSVGSERPVSEIMSKHPRHVRCSEEGYRERAEEYIISEKLHAIPVLDKVDRISDVLFWHEFLEKHPLESHTVSHISNSVVIMAGGKGVRLDPFTKILPKPLIPLGDKPIIEKIIDNFNKYGFNKFSLVLNYKKDLIKAYFKESQYPYSVDWVEEEEYLGTAGGLGLLNGTLKETFFVCNCDILLESDFKNILRWHKEEKSLITLIGCYKEMTFPYGVLKIDAGRLKSINEKPKFDMIINTGVYIMEPKALEFISPHEHLDMNTLVERVAEREKVTVYPVYSGWFDLGQWKEYQESLYLLQNSRRQTTENE